MTNIRVFPTPSGNAKDQDPTHALYSALEAMSQSEKRVTGALVIFTTAGEDDSTETFTVMAGEAFGDYARTIGRLEIAKMAIMLED